MLRVLFIDRSNPVFIQSIRSLADLVGDLPVKLIFLSDKEQSAEIGNLEIINVHDVPQNSDIGDLECKYGFSIHRALAPERSFFDYSSFRRCQCYSELSLNEIGRIVRPYLNAFDYLVREKVDVVIDGLADNFMTSLIGRIAGYYQKSFYMGFIYYWWADGMHFVDRIDQTSTDIDERYLAYMANREKIDRKRIDRVFADKKIRPAGDKYPMKMRVQQFLARRHSYEPPSIKNLVCRIVSTRVSRFAIRTMVRGLDRALDEEFLLFPLHVMPEATLLGSAPEIADQFNLIKNISMNLPFGVRLYVKEHPSQPIGNSLDYGFYRRLCALPNVRYIAASADLGKLLADRRCIGAAVINGTVGLEAAFHHRKPVFVFAPALYSAGGCFIKPKNFAEFYDEVQKIRSGAYRFDEDALYAILQAIDDSVVRAPVDLAQSNTWSEMVIAANPIYRQLIVNCLQRVEAGVHDGNLVA
jgi:hypothetical protein